MKRNHREAGFKKLDLSLNQPLKRSNSSIAYRLIDAGLDCIFQVVLFLNTKEWIQFSYTCKDINDFKYNSHAMINKKKTLGPFDNRKISDCSSVKVTDYLLAMNTNMMFNVNLNSRSWFTDDMCSVFQNTIHTLNMRHCYQISNVSFIKYFQGSIHTLSITNNCASNTIKITDDAFKAIKSTLRVLKADGSQITDSTLHILKDSIHTLELKVCYNITDIGITHLKNSIINLSLGVITAYSDITEEAFRGFKQLQMLEIHESLNITDESIKCLPISLHTLLIPHCKHITDDAFVNMQNNIRVLNINGCYQVKGKTFYNMEGIQDLHATRCLELTDIAIQYISKSIRVLLISHCPKITGKYFHLMKPTIKILEARYCKGIKFSPFKQFETMKVKLDYTGSKQYINTLNNYFNCSVN